MHQLLNEPIDVIVDFSDKRARPRRVRWDNKVYEIKSVNLIHTAKEGQKRLYYFSVSDNSNFMKLQLDTETLEWRIMEIYSE